MALQESIPVSKGGPVKLPFWTGITNYGECLYSGCIGYTVYRHVCMHVGRC